MLKSFSPILTALLAIGLTTLNISVAPAQSDGFREALAGAVRASANHVLPSVVTVEIVGAAEAAGEVEQDAPTSGVIIDDQGHILASSIVVEKPSASILVRLADGSRHAAKEVSRDHHRDLVLLKISTDKPLRPIEISAEPTLKIGQTTIAVGRYGPEGSPMISSGVLSAVDRLDGIALQTDARVSPSYYGGPLVDLYGNVLGFLIPATAGAPDATSWYDSGIAFAIPGSVVLKKIDRLREGNDIRPGLIGIVAKSKDPYENETEIAAVRVRSPAEEAGILAGDHVLEIDHQPVRRHQEIRQVLGRFDAGESIDLKLKRGDEEVEVKVTLAESIPPLSPQTLGVLVSENKVGDDDAKLLVDSVVPNSPAADHFRTGDQITKIGKNAVDSIESLRRIMISAAEETEVEVQIIRDDQDQTIKLTPASVAGEFKSSLPNVFQDEDQGQWEINELKLPDVENVAAILAPKSSDNLSRLGLLVLLLNPGQGSPQESLDGWKETAQKTGVVVCAIAPQDNRRWQPKELEVVARFATAAQQRSPIDDTAVAVASSGALTSGKSEAGDSMALAVAVSQSKSFSGVAIGPGTRPPAIRMRANDASSSLQLLMPIKLDEAAPAWTASLVQAGYPIVRAEEVNRRILLTWVRLLQAI